MSRDMLIEGCSSWLSLLTVFNFFMLLSVEICHGKISKQRARLNFFLYQIYIKLLKSKFKLRLFCSKPSVYGKTKLVINISTKKKSHNTLASLIYTLYLAGKYFLQAKLSYKFGKSTSVFETRTKNNC